MKKSIEKPYDNRLPQKRLEEKAIMTELLKQVSGLANDLQAFPENLRKLLKDAPILVHFNTVADGQSKVIACSSETLRFLRLKKQEIIGKGVWNFFTIATNHFKITREHWNRFVVTQQAYGQLVQDRRLLPETHFLVKFQEETECYIIHFHREYIYSTDGNLLGLLVFMPFEPITYQQFLALEREKFFAVEEEEVYLSEKTKETTKFEPEDKNTSEKSNELKDMDERLAKIRKKLGLVD